MDLKNKVATKDSVMAGYQSLRPQQQNHLQPYQNQVVSQEFNPQATTNSNPVASNQASQASLTGSTYYPTTSLCSRQMAQQQYQPIYGQIYQHLPRYQSLFQAQNFDPNHYQFIPAGQQQQQKMSQQPLDRRHSGLYSISDSTSISSNAPFLAQQAQHYQNSNSQQKQILPPQQRPQQSSQSMLAQTHQQNALDTCNEHYSYNLAYQASRLIAQPVTQGSVPAVSSFQAAMDLQYQRGQTERAPSLIPSGQLTASSSQTSGLGSSSSGSKCVCNNENPNNGYHSESCYAKAGSLNSNLSARTWDQSATGSISKELKAHDKEVSANPSALTHSRSIPDNKCQSSPTLQSSSSSSSPAKNAPPKSTCAQLEDEASDSDANGKLKSYLAQLVLASNIPFAYTVILVAFLITVIIATTIITILTILLTVTGYTAYSLTESTFNISLAIGLVCASLAVALVTATLVVWRRHCQAAYYYLDDPQDASRGTNSPQLSETYDETEYGSIPVSDWAKHVQKLHADSDIGFSREFEQIQQANNSKFSCEHSKAPENKHKNRYINIVAYDHTRVMLRQIIGQKKAGSDYINANYIDSYNKPRAYIGTQGPLVSTFDDYWRMIWEQRVVIIVMITNLQERGRRKCDMYWPKEGTETYGNVQVKLLQEVVMATYTLRTFSVRNLKLKKRPDSERKVYQYHYTNWPDHGVPDHSLPVLSFVRKSASANPSGAGPIICHCSAGCGRSGTYVVIDAMLKQIRHRKSINVVDFLKHIRSQRNYLVQTEEQYIFIHDALVEAIESGETEIASSFISKYIQLLQTGGNSLMSQKASLQSIATGFQSPPPITATIGGTLKVSDSQPLVDPSQAGNLLANIYANKTSNGTLGRAQSASSQWSLLERQYRLVASFKAKDFNVVSALKPCNKNKNRTLNLIPLEAHRVHITTKPGKDGSDYINATFLMGFNHLREFIVTQHPVHETFSDFWQMVYDHNSQTIVLLTPINEQLAKEFPQFWPQKEDEVDYGSFKVKLNQETTIRAENNTLIVIRDFIMRSNQDDYELQTKVIHCPGWPECCTPLSGVFDLIKVVQNATQQQASQQRLHDGLSANTTVTIGQEHEPQNGGPVIVVDKYGGTEAATFAVLTTLYKQINFEDAVDVYMYAKLAHLRRPGIWSSQDDYLFLYRAIENYVSQQQEKMAAANGTQLTGKNGGNSPTYRFNQTMTLDRHKQKSINLLKTSTMRRPNTKQETQQQNNHFRGSQNELNKSNLIKSPELVQNHHLVMDNSTAPASQRPPKNQFLMQGNQLAPSVNYQLQQHIKSMNQQQQHLQAASPPYSAVNGTGHQTNSVTPTSLDQMGNKNHSTHQHLPTSNGLALGPNQHQPANNHYLYPMS